MKAMQRNLNPEPQDYSYDMGEDDEEPEEQDPYGYKVSFFDNKQDEASKRFQEKKKQLQAKREEQKRLKEEEERKEKEERERLEREMEKVPF